MTLNELRDEAYATAKDKGWHDTPRSPLEIHMLIVSEVAEATECVRKDEEPFYKVVDPNDHTTTGFVFKPEGEAVELADAVIRIANYFGEKGWDLEAVVRAKMDYNGTRSYRHGGKAI